MKFKYVYFILIGSLSLHACKNKPSDDQGSVPETSSSKTKEDWLVNLNDAYAQSVKDHKRILAYFTSSDSCGLCNQLEKDVFSTPVFKSWAEKYVVLLKVDLSKYNQLPEGDKEQNAAMAQSLKANIYPTIWILNVTHEANNGRFKVKPIGYTGYQPSPDKLIGALQNFMRR